MKYNYEMPTVEVEEIAVEQGFTVSGTIDNAETDQWGDY